MGVDGSIRGTAVQGTGLLGYTPRNMNTLEPSTSHLPPLALAPMATLSHRGLRTQIEEWGDCDFYFSEMVDCGSFISGRQYESYYTDPLPRPEKLILQFVGSEIEGFAQALERAADFPVSGFDINMGCSARQIWGIGGGIAWMEQPEQAKTLVETLRPLVKKGKTLSVKLRLGLEENPDYLKRFCLGLQDAGADFLTLHPRTRKDTLSRPSRWNHLKQLRQELQIPLWGNGDIKDLESARAAAGTGAASLMIGREAVRSPWIFHWIREKNLNPAYTLRVDLQAEAEKFYANLEAFQPEDFWPTRAQRFWAYFSSHFVFGHRLAAQLKNYREYPRIKDHTLGYLADHPEERFLILS